MNRVNAGQLGVHLTYDAHHRVLHLRSDRCVLRTKEDVAAYFTHCYARLRTFELPAAIIIGYDELEVTGEALLAFPAARDQCVEKVGGCVYRYAATERARASLAASRVRSKTPFVLYTSYDEALAQVLGDRGGPFERMSQESWQRRMDEMRAARRC